MSVFNVKKEKIKKLVYIPVIIILVTSVLCVNAEVFLEFSLKALDRVMKKCGPVAQSAEFKHAEIMGMPVNS